MIFIVGGTLAFFFEFLLLSKKGKYLADKILTLWMFLIGIHLFLYYFELEGIDFRYPHLLGIVQPLPLLHGPFLFLYTRALSGTIKKIRAIDLLHFLPPVIFYLYYFNFFISSGNEKIDFVKNIMEDPGLFFIILEPLIILSGFTYIILTFIQFKKHRKNIQDIFSNTNEKNNLHWIRNLIIGLLIVWIVVLLSEFVLDPAIRSKAVYISVVVFVVFMGYFGIRQGNIFVNHPPLELSSAETKKDQKRYSKSGLKDNQADELQKHLLNLMEDQKLFLDENLSLPQLAQILNTHPNYLSQVINEKFKRNFNGFVNYYRIEEFKRLVALDQNKKMTILGLAYECGFNSKASFNNSFKKFTGTTPSSFVKSH